MNEKYCILENDGVALCVCKHKPCVLIKRMQEQYKNAINENRLLKAELEQSKNYAELLKANRCHHTVLGECSQEHHSNCVGKKQCILDLEQIINDLKAENEKLKEKYLASLRDNAINTELKLINDNLKAENDTLHITISKLKADLSQAETSLYAWKAEVDAFRKIRSV